MNKSEATILLKDHPDLKIQMLNWASRFSIFCFLDNNGYEFEDAAFECLLGAGCVRSFSFPAQNAFSGLQQFFDDAPSWLFGHMSYNAAGNAYRVENAAAIFERGFFFEPEIVLRLSKEKLTAIKTNIPAAVLYKEITDSSSSVNKASVPLKISPLISKENYLEQVRLLKEHIHRGDCYEINFCQQFEGENAIIDPMDIYQKLREASPAPFSAFYKIKNSYCLCASPERFLKKSGDVLISQPIKGTRRRNVSDAAQDLLNKNALAGSEKDRAENVMITDLVRNDLSMVAEKGSVKVKELFGVYSFPQVHHLISTVKARLSAERNFTDAVKACFPMGSMTGAPKKKVMELIELSEEKERGLFSGSIGYVTPEADFDFNVVIRSIFFDDLKKQVSFFAGGAITASSDPEAEYDESMVKAEAIIKVLSGK